MLVVVMVLVGKEDVVLLVVGIDGSDGLMFNVGGLVDGGMV